GEGWYGIAMFSIQIYFDFSGYSDMAIGLGRMFGFHYHENFKHPYVSTSITDFWRRWHISLGTFFRDYVYIPMGGNRKNAVMNIMVVWALTGLWHGASWNFIIWGMYFGVLLLIEKILLKELLAKAPKIVQHLYALFFIVVGWSIFYFTDLTELKVFVGTLFSVPANLQVGLEVQSSIEQNIFWLIFALALCMPVYDTVGNKLKSKITNANTLSFGTVTANFIMLLIATALLVNSSYNPFLYFRF
ncbi:MAG: MBOAT family O-acyltransferase, partial [Bacteroidota bacterium]